MTSTPRLLVVRLIRGLLKGGGNEGWFTLNDRSHRPGITSEEWGQTCDTDYES